MSLGYSQLDSVQFREQEVDRAIKEADIVCDLSIEEKRCLVARVMLGVSLAAALHDTNVLEESIASLGEPVIDPAQIYFMTEFKRRVLSDLADDLGPAIENFDSLFGRAGFLAF